jgi:ABC-type multidrug transport system permease subunit
MNILSTFSNVLSNNSIISSIIPEAPSLIFFLIVLIIIFFFINLFQAHAIGIGGEKQGLRVEIIRIVLQTLTFTSGT